MAAKSGLKPFTKEQWADPEYRARMKERDARTKQMRKDDPWAVKPWGIPLNIGGKKKAIPLWRAAHKLADKYLDYMKKTDQAPSDMDVTSLIDLTSCRTPKWLCRRATKRRPLSRYAKPSC
jgi:hypothetical protein